MSGDARVQPASPVHKKFTLPEVEGKGSARGLVLLSSLHLEEHAGHVRLWQEGLGKTPGGTRGFRDESLMNGPLTKDRCLHIDSFGCAAVIYQIFCPRTKELGYDAYRSVRCRDEGSSREPGGDAAHHEILHKSRDTTTASSA
jgi:hypothetical protein